MAFNLYAQDYNGSFYYSVFGKQWDDSSTTPTTNVYFRYLGKGDSVTMIRNMRICPARMGRTDPSTTHSYSMPIGTYKKGLQYANADTAGSPALPNPFYDSATGSYFPSLTFLPQPSSFLLLIEGNGNTLKCGGLVSATTHLHSGTGGDTIPAVNFHGGGGVNSLFGDFHVEFVSSQVITNQDAISCSTGNPWFKLN
jgi:prepilin-type processing-associated H-X9-DG protein